MKNGRIGIIEAQEVNELEERVNEFISNPMVTAVQSVSAVTQMEIAGKEYYTVVVHYVPAF